MRRVNWFGNKGRKIESVQLIDRIFLSANEQAYAILLVEVNFRTGFSELFQIPTTFQEVSDLGDVWLKEEVIGIADIGKKGILLDAFYDDEFRLAIINNANMLSQSGVLSLDTWADLPEMTESTIRKSTVQYIAVAYKEGYFVKFYRRIDQKPNPDFDLTYWLTRQHDFQHVPELLAGISYKDKRNYNTTLATIQPLVTHQGYAWNYVTDYLKRLIEDVAVNAENQSMPAAQSSMFDAAISYEDWAPIFQSSNLQDFLERINLIARRTAQMHLALTDSESLGDPSFQPELFSLHYQRSLFSALKSLVRVSMKTLRENLEVLSEEYQTKGRELLAAQNKMLDYFQRIYVHKFEAAKIRIHGNFHLEQIMMAGDDIKIDDFDGTFERPFSERKLRKSPLIDVATLLRSMHYAKWSIQEQNQEVESISNILKYWYENMSSTFLKTYQEEIAQAGIAEFIPDNKDDFRILIEVFMLERALKELLYEFDYRPEMAHIAIEGVLDLLNN